MINRQLSDKLEKLSQSFLVVAILGPRQSGKTTLAKHTFPNHRYVSLEDFDRREFALSDPRGFLDTYAEDGVIIDEVQHAPTLFSYIQTVERRSLLIYGGKEDQKRTNVQVLSWQHLDKAMHL